MPSSLLANQCLTYLRPDLIVIEDSLRINKNITRKIACLKRGYTYGNKYISCMSMLETCAQYIICLFCRNESCCFMRHKHLAFQCEYNDDETLDSYAKGSYDFYDAEQIE